MNNNSKNVKETKTDETKVEQKTVSSQTTQVTKRTIVPQQKKRGCNCGKKRGFLN